MRKILAAIAALALGFTDPTLARDINLGGSTGGGGGVAGVASVNSRTGAVTLLQSDVQSALGNYGPTAGGYGSATAVATFTTDAHGLLIAAGSTTIAIPHTQITDWSATLSSLLAGYATLSGNETFTGSVAFSSSPTAPTPSVGDNSTRLATTAFGTASLAANLSLMLPGGQKTGSFYHPFGHTLGVALGAANTVALMPFYVSGSHTAVTLGVIISSANASAWNARFGIYTDNGGTPQGGTLVSGSDAGAVAVAANATGNVTSTISASLTTGWYWLAFNADSTGVGLQSLSASNTTGVNADAMTLMLGQSTMTTNNSTGFSAAQTFGAMPGTLGTASRNNVAATPMIWIAF